MLLGIVMVTNWGLRCGGRGLGCRRGLFAWSLCLHLGAIADFLRLTLFAGSGDFADPWLGVSGSLALRLVCHRLGCVPSIRVQRTGRGHSPIVTELRRYFAVGEFRLGPVEGSRHAEGVAPLICLTAHFPAGGPLRAINLHIAAALRDDEDTENALDDL